MILNGQHTQRIGGNKSATDSFIWIAKKKEIQSIQTSNKALTHSMDIWARERTQHTRYRWVDSQNKQMKLNREWNGRCAKRAKKIVCVCGYAKKGKKRIRNTIHTKYILAGEQNAWKRSQWKQIKEKKRQNALFCITEKTSMQQQSEKKIIW